MKEQPTTSGGAESIAINQSETRRRAKTFAAAEPSDSLMFLYSKIQLALLLASVELRDGDHSRSSHTMRVFLCFNSLTQCRRERLYPLRPPLLLMSGDGHDTGKTIRGALQGSSSMC